MRVGIAYLVIVTLGDLAIQSGPFYKWALNEIWHVIYILPVIYLFFEFTLPNLNRKVLLKSFLLLVFQIFLFSFGANIWRNLGIMLSIHNPFVNFDSCAHGACYQFGESIFGVIFFGIIKHVYNHIKLKQTTQQLKIEKQEAELNYLKSQTNPHFLFNTLNNIYSLARDKSDLAPESILRLSKILRYMLYETSGAFIAIEKELKIISDYLELEKLRYDDSLNINFNYNVEDMNQALPPLLLIPLVENAFKHGVSETRNQPFVDIHLEVKNRLLTFTVKNSSIDFTSDEKVKENIGLSNLRRQLELLFTDYNLSVRQDNSVFIAELKINLASYV